jgi:GT2 family glycosyltransferase
VVPPVTVIIPAYRAQATLPAVLAALRPQAQGKADVVLVDSSGPAAAGELQAAHPWLTVIAPSERTLPGRARNLGAEHARGAQLAFLDADAIPSPDWLGRLRAAAGGAAAVAGVVANATPGHAIGTASYLLEFSEFIPGTIAPPRHGASCNLLVDRGAFEAAGGFDEELWPGEDTVLTRPWALSGRLGLAPDAVVSHLNRTGAAELMRHQYRLGRSFAAVCDRVEIPHARLSRWPLLPIGPALRLPALLARARGHRVTSRRLARVLPIVSLGLAAWGAGVAAERAHPEFDHAPGR